MKRTMMASKIRKHLKYNKNVHPKEYFDYCKRGYTLDMIAVAMGAITEDLIKWSKNTRMLEWQHVWQRGKEAAKAFHEAKLMEMSETGASQSAINSRLKLLETSFGKNWEKGDWDKTKESTVKVSYVETLDDNQLTKQIAAKTNRLKLVKPEIMNKVVNDE